MRKCISLSVVLGLVVILSASILTTLAEGNDAFRLIYTAEEEPATAPVPGGNDAKSVTSPAATPDAANGAQSDSAVKTGAVTAVSVLLFIAAAAGYAVIKLKAKEE